MHKIKQVFLLVTLLLLQESCYVYDDVPGNRTIILPQPMLDVLGNEVESIQLESGTAAILRYKEPAVGNSVLNLNVNAPPQGQIRAGKSVRLGGYFYGGWTNGNYMSSDQLEWISNNLDILSLNPNYVIPGSNLNGGATPDDIARLKLRNPQFKFYCMLFATTLREPQFDPTTMSGWVVRDKNGKEAIGVRRGYDNDLNHLMDLGNEDYAAYFRDFIISHTNQYHADGVVTDEVMWEGYWGLDIKDMRDYSSVEQITQTCYDWLERIKTNNPKEVIHQAFWSQAQQYTNGIWGEVSFYSWFRDNAAYPVFYEKINYSEIVDAIRSYGHRGETYIWAAWYDQNDPAELEYAVATYLLGKSGDYVVFQPQPIYNGGYGNNLAGYDIGTSIREYETNKNILDVELGDPIGDYYYEKHNFKNIWVRKFTNGIVYCNPAPD